MSDRTVRLSGDEALAYATRVAAHRLADPDDWFEWEDHPGLDEQSVVMVVDALCDVAKVAARDADSVDVELDIDSRYLIERAS